MKRKEIKFKNSSQGYSIIIGENILGILPKKIKVLCPKSKNIALVIDKNVPKKFKNSLSNKLKNYNLTFLTFEANEKAKSFKMVDRYLNILLKKNFNRSDLVIAVGGGITGDIIGFVSSIYKRGINFINLPTTLLAQVDSAIGGKTGVNSAQGKNLIGSFYQPRLVLNDISFLSSLPKKEMICGYAEILKHAIIKDQNFFIWLKKNSKAIFLKSKNELINAIEKSCLIKIHFVNQDVNEKGLRMKLNFGHTFAHAIEAKNKFSKNISHGEAVLSGMILAIKLSIIYKTCNEKILHEVKNLYFRNNLSYTFKNFKTKSSILNLIPYLKNDKKNDDSKINFILLKKIGQTTQPNLFKISIPKLKKICNSIIQY